MVYSLNNSLYCVIKQILCRQMFHQDPETFVDRGYVISKHEFGFVHSPVCVLLLTLAVFKNMQQD